MFFLIQLAAVVTLIPPWMLLTLTVIWSLLQLSLQRLLVCTSFGLVSPKHIFILVSLCDTYFISKLHHLLELRTQ